MSRITRRIPMVTANFVTSLLTIISSSIYFVKRGCTKDKSEVMISKDDAKTPFRQCGRMKGRSLLKRTRFPEIFFDR